MMGFDISSIVIACSDFAAYKDFWINAQFADAIICPFQDTMSLLLFATLFWGGVAIYYHQSSSSVALPVVVALLIGTLAIRQVPSSVANLAGIIAIFAFVAAAYVVGQRIRQGRV